MNSIESLHSQIDAANAEIERIKRICSELWYSSEGDFDMRFEVAMRSVLWLSKPVPPIEIDEKDIPY